MIQILVALFINFRALKVVKWARMLPAAANPVSVDPSKNGTKRSGSEEVVKSRISLPVPFILVNLHYFYSVQLQL